MKQEKRLLSSLFLFFALLLGAASLSACQAHPLAMADLQSFSIATEAQNQGGASMAETALRVPEKLLLSQHLQGDRAGNMLVPDVPFVAQERDNRCAQAAMTMLLQFWGQDIAYEAIKYESNSLNIASSYQSVQNDLSRNGLKVQAYRNSNLELLLTELAAGRPVLVLLSYGSLNTEHYVVVTGFNLHSQSLLLHDSQAGPYQAMPLDEFLQRWQNRPLVQLPVFGGNDYYRLMFRVEKPNVNEGP